MTLEAKPEEFSFSNGHSRTENGDSKKHRENVASNDINMVSFIRGDSIADPVNDESKVQKTLSLSEKFFSWRYAMVVMLHLSFLVAVFARNCMPIALVCMTQTRSEHDHSANASMENGTSNYVFIEESEYEFSWNSETQGLILSSVSFLSFLAPLIANFISPYFGHKNTLTAMTLTSAVILILTPVATRTSPWLLIALRVLLGATFGASVPAVGDCMARWAPNLEKGTMVAFVYIGLQTGSTFCSLLSGYLCLVPIDNGWPFIFYVIGAIVFLWVILWHIFSSAKPEDHRYISEKELKYIKLHRGINETEHKKETQTPPYRTILTSTPVLCLLVCSSLHYWSVILIFTYMPIYIAAVLNFSVTETGELMTILSVARCVGMIVITLVVNKMIAQKKWSATTVKKFSIACGTLLSAAGHLPAIFLTSDDRWVIIGFFLATMFFQSSTGCILPAISLDLAPRYAGFIGGLAFSCGGLIGISGPLVAASLTPNNTAEEWKMIWIISGSAFVLICVVFVTFGDCTIQPWAKDDRENPPEVVSPFDPMAKRLSAAMETSPVFSLSPDRQLSRELVLVVDKDQISPAVFTTESATANATQPTEEAREEFPADNLSITTDGSINGVLNDGFESELDRTIPPLNTQDVEHVRQSDDEVIVVRF